MKPEQPGPVHRAGSRPRSGTSSAPGTSGASGVALLLSRAAPALVLGMVASLAGCGADGDEAGRCPPARLIVTPTVAAPGDRITVTGDHVFDDCADDGRANPVTPGEDVPVVWEQGARPRIVARVSADDRGRVTTLVTVPLDADPGRATLRMLDAQPVDVMIR